MEFAVKQLLSRATSRRKCNRDVCEKRNVDKYGNVDMNIYMQDVKRKGFLRALH